MPIAIFKKPGVVLPLVLLLIFAVLLPTAHVRKPHWQWIGYVTPSPDGRTLTAKLMFGEPKADGTFCEQVTDMEVRESASQVAIGIQVLNTCAPLVSWGRTTTTDIGYPFDVNLHLRAPLTGRTVVDKETGQPIEIAQPSDRS
ncbi:hypothetical protein [Streptosporangium sp. NPDC049644]|uniref:hypothetical protein n=1 Tax=Streptosporangium sp. NPDC049644 TaxID=3155507 RepID=UPI00342AB8AF